MSELVGKLKEALAPLAPSHGVRLAYVFGSAAAGRTRPESDLDIAVLLRDDPARDESGTEAALEPLRVPLARAAGVAPDRLDLVCLNLLPRGRGLPRRAP